MIKIVLIVFLITLLHFNLNVTSQIIPNQPPYLRLKTFIDAAADEFALPNTILSNFVQQASDKETQSSIIINGMYNIKSAACLLNILPEQVKLNPIDNIRGIAALFIKYSQDINNAPLPSTFNNWDPAANKIMNQESSSNTVPDDCSTVQAQWNIWNPTYLKNSDNPLIECPDGLVCINYPIILSYPPNQTPGNYIFNNYGNYDPTTGRIPCNTSYNDPSLPRAKEMDVCAIVIHDTESNAHDTIRTFMDPNRQASSHYFVLANGTVMQFVATKNIAWHALSTWNYHSIGIEHEGKVNDPDHWFGDAQYAASAKLVRYLAAKYNVPITRSAIFGHSEAQGNNRYQQRAMHYDPGSYWDINKHFEFMSVPITPTPYTGSNPLLKNIITFKPNFDTNLQEFPPKFPTGPHPSNAVPLYYEPGSPDGTIPADVKLFADVAINSIGSCAQNYSCPITDIIPGTAHLDQSDWGCRIYSGRNYYRISHIDNWSQIYFAGTSVWFYNPNEMHTIQGMVESARLITPKGNKPIHVYASTFPMKLNYTPNAVDFVRNLAIDGYGDILPSSVPSHINPHVTQDNTLMYLIYPGQYYVAYEQEIPNVIYVFDPFNTSHWQAVYYDDPNADNYYRISLNSRWAYVKVKDVILIEDLSKNNKPSNTIGSNNIKLAQWQIITIIVCSIVFGVIVTIGIGYFRKRFRAKKELEVNLNYISSGAPPTTSNGAVVTV